MTLSGMRMEQTRLPSYWGQSPSVDERLVTMCAPSRLGAKLSYRAINQNLENDLHL